MASIAFCFTRWYQVLPKSVGQVAKKHWRTADPCRQDDQPGHPSIQIPHDFTYVGTQNGAGSLQWGLRQTHFTSSKKPCGVPNRGVPNRGVPNRGVPNRGVPNRGVPSRGVPEPGVCNRGVPERGVPERGVPTRGVPTRGTGGSVIYTAREECWVVCVCCWMWSMFEYNKLFTCWNML